MANIDKIKTQDSFVRLFDLWAKKTPSYETHYESEVIKPLSDFGKGTNEASDAKGKILGAGYETLIMAFFIGLYNNRMMPLDEYADVKDLGQPIQFWGNIDSKKNRHAYSRLKEYIFIALVARTPEIDWISLDKGRVTTSETVALLMITMEQYINFGLSVIYDKIKNNDGYFYGKNSFLDIFIELTRPKTENCDDDSEDKPDSLY